MLTDSDEATSPALAYAWEHRWGEEQADPENRRKGMFGFVSRDDTEIYSNVNR